MRLHRTNTGATSVEREVLARWQGWGAHPGVFDPRREPTATEQAARDAIAEAEEEWPGYGDIARGSILNAHYTDPTIIAPVWEALRRLGVDDEAVVWEPGCGVGEWLRSPQAPAARFDAIDLDPVSATITELLTGPEAHVTADTLERWVIARSTHTNDGYDAVVGNVPFTKAAPEIDNPHRDSLHNYTIARAAGMTRPGGVIALITSRYTLDAGDSRFRERLADDVDLIGAVRLPSDAHKAHAGTSVVTDLLLLRRPLPGEQRPPADWLSTTSTLVDGQPVKINDYFREHPDRVLGAFALGGMRHRADLRVVADTDLAAGLTAALTEITAQAPVYAPAGRAPRAGDAYNPPTRRRITVDDLSLPAGTIVHRHGHFSLLTPTGPQPHTPRFQSYRGELAALCDLRDDLYRTMAADASGDTIQAVEHRQTLNVAYDRYAARYGPLNRFSERAPAHAGDDDTDVVYRVNPPLGGFRHDPTWWTLAAVEVFDEQTQTAGKAPVFQRAVTRTAAWPDSAANACDAVAISLAKHGRLDVDELAELLDVDADGVDYALGDLAFRQPGDARLVPATEYLAGDVVAKLAVAETAALEDPQRWRRNVDELRRVQPATIEAGDIVVRIGATWIDKSVIADYLAGIAEVHASNITIVHSAHIATWEISGPLTSKACGWGTRKRTLYELATDIANQRLTHITMTNADDKQVLDQDSTAEANDKRREIEDDFQDWVWRNPDRTQQLVAAYNDRFNRWVAPVYDGSHLLLPGLAPTFTPRPKQLDGTWRILTSRDRGTLLAHAVGAGKTATMVMAAMEARRLGTAPGTVMIVVENSMLEQFSREFLQLYPGANVLVADSINFDPRRRKQFSARVATGDFDVVVITHQGFKAIPISDDWMRHVITNELAQIDTAARDIPERSRSSKQLASARDSYRKKLKELGERAGHDPDAITFEELNVSMLIVDEAQVYKNLAFDTQITGAGGQKGSAIAFDALTKIDWMRHHQGPGSIVFATATPIANAISECWVMQRFLDPAGLDAAGCRHFDGWAANFARSVSTIEVKPTGGGFRTTSRFAEYTNVPELVAMFRATADVQTATELNLPRPTLIGGEPQIVAVPQTWDQSRVLEWLEQRAIAPNRNDCLLAVMTDGRLCALTPRLLGPRLVGAGVYYDTNEPDDEPGGAVELPAKLDACASNVLTTWQQHRDRVYLTATGEPSPNRGCAQIVFCDDGVPANENYDAYSALKARLVEGGMEPASIAFIHDAKTHRQRGELFSDVRDGHVAVLIGSIRQCGVGVNIQSRLAAMHQITVPWRPADIEQAEGRILRQGNQNSEVSIRRYVAERSFDAYSWQTIERKARSIAQIMSDPKTLDRTITDDSDPAATYALVKATATGDPRFLTHATLGAEVERLERLERSHQRNTRLAADSINTNTRRTHQRASLRDRLQPLIEAEPVTTGIITSSLDGTIAASDIGSQAIDVSQRLNLTARHYDATEQLGVIDGVPIRLHVRHDSSVHATIDGVDVRACMAERAWTYHEFIAKRPEDIGRAITNIARSVPSTVHRMELDDASDAAATEAAHTQLATPFNHSDRLTAARSEHSALTAELMADKPPTTPPDDTASDQRPDQRADDRQYEALYRAHPQHRTTDWTV